MRKTLLGLLLLLTGVVALNAAQPSGTLPVMYISTENNAPITSKETYVKGTYYLDPKGVAGVDAFGSEAAPLPLQIRGRGNYTWVGFNKKPYRLKLDKKAALFGEAKSKHWALLAEADDNKSFLRNEVGFQLSRLVGLPWTPAHHPVEVVLNGDYIGLYFLTETVRVDKDRVNVWDYDSEYEDYADANPGQTLPWNDEYATGGWLCEIDNYDDADQVKVTSIDPYNYEPGNVIRITYDTPSDYITDAHKNWLRNEFSTLDEMIVNGDRNACKWAEKIDLTNLARFFIVNQIVFNYESFHGSCKLSREKGADSKWNFGPVWDFGSAFQTTDDVRQLFFNYGPYTNHWIKTMYEYPAFQAEVKRVYKELKDNGYSSLDSYIDNYLNSIKGAMAADYDRWSGDGYGNNDADSDKAFVKGALSNSIGYLDNLWLGNDPGPGPDPDPNQPSSDIYLRGGMNGWNAEDGYKFSKNADGIWELSLDELKAEHEFKLAGPVWGSGNVDFCGVAGGSTVEANSWFTLTYQGGNLKASQDLQDVTLLFDWNEKKLMISTDVAPQTYTVYFQNDDAYSWEEPYIFTYGPSLHGNWPGTKMELAGTSQGKKIWKHTFERKHEIGATCLVFGNGGSGQGNQTDDLQLYNNALYSQSGKIADTPTGIGSVVEDDPNAPVEYYNLQGIRVASPESGIYIRRQGGKSKLVKL